MYMPLVTMPEVLSKLYKTRKRTLASEIIDTSSRITPG
jgi:hypothetical protein